MQYKSGQVRKISIVWLLWCIVWLMVALLMGAALARPLSAQEAPPDTAQLRLGHFVFDGEDVGLVMDGVMTLGQDGEPVLFSPMTLPSQYLDLAEGVHTFAVTAEGGSLDAALVPEQEFTLEIGHRYLLALMGNVSEDDLHLMLIDETAAMEANDITQSAVSLFINNLAGVPAIDWQFDGEPFLTDVAYGDYAIYQDPTEGIGSFITAAGDPMAVILDVPYAEGSPAYFFAVFAFSGTFSGTPWEGYTALYTGSFEGSLTIIDSGVISVGDVLPLEFTEMGQRVQYTLTLDTPTVLNITQTGESGLDPFLRMYDTNGNLQRESDEITMLDNPEGIYDAGWLDLSLEAGTYIIEAGTFIDTGTGASVVTVDLAN